jgi:hypothetical protein
MATPEMWFEKGVTADDIVSHGQWQVLGLEGHTRRVRGVTWRRPGAGERHRSFCLDIEGNGVGAALRVDVYLPTVAEGCEELDSFDFIEDLKIKDGPLVCLLTGISLLEGLSDAWVQEHRRAESTVKCLLQRWQRDGLPGFAQFDNDTVFQGAHQFPDAIGRVTRLCLALGVTPVFAPPREPGFQNAIEGFNGLWQSKVWRRIQCSGIVQMQESSDRYVRAHRNRNASRRDTSTSRKPFPDNFYFDPKSPMQGTVIFLRRTDEEGRAQLLGRSFAISSEWCHRLVRCEVDLNCRRIRVYALRRREPAAQPLLVSIPYRRIQKRSFQG